MHADELELFTTEELIGELLRRKTFQGVVVHSEDDYRRPEWSGEKVFHVHFNGNLDADEVSRLLNVVADHIQFSP
jgi:hypothetical protein